MDNEIKQNATCTRISYARMESTKVCYLQRDIKHEQSKRSDCEPVFPEASFLLLLSLLHAGKHTANPSFAAYVTPCFLTQIPKLPQCPPHLWKLRASIEEFCEIGCSPQLQVFANLEPTKNHPLAPKRVTKGLSKGKLCAD